MRLWHAAWREARAELPGLMGLALFAAPLAIVPYLAGLAVDATGRVASDAAYLYSVLAAQGTALVIGLFAALPESGWTHVQRSRGFPLSRLALFRALGFLAAGAPLLAGATLGAFLAASFSGAEDATRMLLPVTGAAATFGLTLFMATLLPRAGAALAAGAFLIAGQLLEVGRPFNSLWFQFLLPPYSFFDAWPGTRLTLREWTESAACGLLYGVIATILSARLREGRRE